MADNQTRYYVKVSYEWGKSTGSERTAESVGTMEWSDLHYEQSVALQNNALIPGVKVILDESGNLGMEAAELSGTPVPGKTKK
jgi:hypothetical protein